MKTKTICLRVTISTEDREVLEDVQVVTELDLETPYKYGANTIRALSGGQEAGSAFMDALATAFNRAKEKKE